MQDHAPPHATAGPAAPQLALDQQLCFPLYAASNLLTRLYRPLLRALGLTYPQYLVMLVLWEHGSATVGGLGERLHLDSGTLTPLLKRLEAAGLVSRQREAGDERRVRVHLTPAGTALRAQAQGVPQALSCRITGSARPPSTADLAAIATLREALQGLVRQLEAAVQTDLAPADPTVNTDTAGGSTA